MDSEIEFFSRVESDLSDPLCDDKDAALERALVECPDDFTATEEDIAEMLEAMFNPC